MAHRKNQLINLKSNNYKMKINSFFIVLSVWICNTALAQVKLQANTDAVIKNASAPYMRVSALGFICNAETADDALERDGKRDEVYLSSQSHKVDAQGRLVANTAVQHRSRLMGDINARNPVERRVMAGTADGGLGGIKTGDQIPDFEPFKNNAPASGDLLPFILWEGQLTNGEKAIVNPSIFEWDGPEDFLTTFWHKSFVGILLRVNPVSGIASIPFQALGVGQATPYNFDTPGVWPAVGVAQQFPKLFQKVNWDLLPAKEKAEFTQTHMVAAHMPADRPIGVENNNLYNPLYMHLDTDIMGRLISYDAGYGKGVLPLYFNDKDGLNGKYVLFIRFEIVTNEKDKNRINLQSTDAFDPLAAYSFRNVNASDKEADILGGGKTSNTHVVLNDLKGLQSQRWTIRKANQFYFNIINNYNNLYLDILNKYNINGSNIVSSQADGNDSQLWSFVRYCDGSWLVRNFKTNRMMEVYNGGKTVFSPLGQWDATALKNQRWFIEK